MTLLLSITIYSIFKKKTNSLKFGFQRLKNNVNTTSMYYKTLWYFSTNKEEKLYKECRYFEDNKYAKLHVYSLALILKLWDKPHYRNGTFKEDMIKNLRNVAIPGTGIPLSWFCYTKITVWLFLLILYPIICIFSSLKGKDQFYQDQLINPKDWFSFWRLNCRLASYHSNITKSADFALENKWTFLDNAKNENIPVSQWLDIEDLVIKDKNEEGGMGIYFFKNAANGGDWIIQEKLNNSKFISNLLPKNAPLSTFRVITASRYSLSTNRKFSKLNTLNNDNSLLGGNGYIKSLSCVFRAGRQNAKTDHDSILFDVDINSGLIGKGTTNEHWYKLGLKNIFTTKWFSEHNITHHPDNNIEISNNQIPNFENMIELVNSAHLKLLPNVPLAGWDIAFTTKGILLLEVNLSCNFFRGSFDSNEYIRFIDDHFTDLELKST